MASHDQAPEGRGLQRQPRRSRRHGDRPDLQGQPPYTAAAQPVGGGPAEDCGHDGELRSDPVPDAEARHRSRRVRGRFRAEGDQHVHGLQRQRPDTSAASSRALEQPRDAEEVRRRAPLVRVRGGQHEQGPDGVGKHEGVRRSRPTTGTRSSRRRRPRGPTSRRGTRPTVGSPSRMAVPIRSTRDSRRARRSPSGSTTRTARRASATCSCP